MGIAKRCENLGVVIYEILHALGMYHEYSRRDRDKYITIIEENIIPEHEIQFRKVDDYEGKPYGIHYDYGSAMHYERAVENIKNRTTIVTKKQTLYKINGTNYIF
uniref:Metalloendopeptidase n=1 Tax=Strongyloides venezuelensis TaxID=75913 RepID=A0A0K0EUB8_STRVS